MYNIKMEKLLIYIYVLKYLNLSYLFIYYIYILFNKPN